MENNRKGICINIGNCNQADNKIVQDVSISADFVCSECGRDLTPIVEKKKLKLKKPLIIAIPIIILMLIGGYIWYYYSKAKGVVETAKTAINETKKVIQDIPVGNDLTSDSSISSNSNLQHSVQDALNRISNAHNSEEVRLGFVKEVMQTIFSKDFYVIMHDDDARSLERIWDRGDGEKYLNRIATDDSITGFDILKIETNTTDHKVSFVEVVEKHNK